MRIAIVGAGAAGCIMARSLSCLKGVEVICLEQVEAGHHLNTGTGLVIGPNSISALEWHDPDLLAAVNSASFTWKTWRTSLTDGTVMANLRLRSIADTDGRRIRWSELYRVFREAAGAAISYGCAITRVSRCAGNPSQSEIEWTQDGEQQRLDRIDLLIATDGRYSNVRDSISGRTQIRQVGIALSRLLVPDTSHGLIDDYEQWFNQGGGRLLAFRVPPSHLYLTCAFPIDPQRPIPEEMKEVPWIRRNSRLRTEN